MAVSLKGINPVLGAGALVAVIAVAGWFGWQQFAGSESDPLKGKLAAPVPKVAAKAPAPKPKVADPEALIAELLSASGVKRKIEGIPDNVRNSARESSARSGLSISEAQSLEAAATEAFAPAKFIARVSASLKAGVDAPGLQAYLDDLNSPLGKRMGSLEEKTPTQVEVAAFATMLAEKPLAPTRAETIKRLDTAGRVSEFSIEAIIAIFRGMIGGSSPPQSAGAKIEEMLLSQRATASGKIREATQIALAYIYRDVSDTDLDEYAKLLEKESHRKLVDLQFAALVEQFQESAAAFGAGVEKLIQAKKASQVGEMTADAGGTRAMGPADPSRPSRAHLDARQCLKSENNQAVIRCAESYL